MYKQRTLTKMRHGRRKLEQNAKLCSGNKSTTNSLRERCVTCTIATKPITSIENPVKPNPTETGSFMHHIRSNRHNLWKRSPRYAISLTRLCTDDVSVAPNTPVPRVRHYCLLSRPSRLPLPNTNLKLSRGSPLCVIHAVHHKVNSFA